MIKGAVGGSFLDIESFLSPEERMIRDSVRDFANRRLLPQIGDWFERGEFPVELAPEFGHLGLLGMHLQGYGCAGASAVSYGLAAMELEAVDSGIRSFVSVQGSLAMFPIRRFGSEDQKTEWLPRMARGEAIGCFGLTEPEVGSNPAAMRSTARRVGTDWVLDGTKMWITNGSIADVAVIWARTDDGVRGFLVSKGTRGFSARNINRKLSMRASVTSELLLENCTVSADAILPLAIGLSAPMACLDEARYGVAWGALGAARTCYEAALAYATTRVQFDKAIAGFQLIQRQLVEMLLELEKGTLVALHVGRLKDQGLATAKQVSFAKLNNARHALSIARQARSILGANGITLEYPVIRHMNNLESVFTYEGTDEMHTLIIGEAITGIAAFR